MRIAIHQGPATSAGAAALAAPAVRAAAAGADLLVCPEMITTGYHVGAQIPKVAEAAGGPSAAVVAGIAREFGIAIAYGYPERDGETVFNSVQLIGGDDARLANYRKTHLFGELDRTWFTPGQRAVVQAELNGMRVGLLICYDVEFPEIVRAHALACTELLLVPTALMSPYEIVADTVVPARAYESQLYLAYANHTGRERELRYCGRSCVVSPTGEVIARGGAEETLLLADVDAKSLLASRAENTHLDDRRPELYREPSREGATA